MRLWARRAWDAEGREIAVELVLEGRRRVRFLVDAARVGAAPGRYSSTVDRSPCAR